MARASFFFSTDYVFNQVLEPHQKIRIEVLLGMKDDPAGAGYNVNQSKIAIGSGGLFGKGFLNGTQTKLKYVPEQDTDFILCTIGEEQGFVGSALVIFLFYGTHSTPYRAIRTTGKPLWKSIRLLCTEYILFPSLHQYRNGTRTNPRYRYPPPILQLRRFLTVGIYHPAVCLSPH